MAEREIQQDVFSCSKMGTEVRIMGEALIHFIPGRCGVDAKFTTSFDCDHKSDCGVGKSTGRSIGCDWTKCVHPVVGCCYESKGVSHGSLVTPAPRNVTIDILPGVYPNIVNVSSDDPLPVAIFSTPDFDATSVDPKTVTLDSAPAKLKGQGKPVAVRQDVNGDGLLDLIVLIDLKASDIATTIMQAVLEGNTYNGISIVGTDSIQLLN